MLKIICNRNTKSIRNIAKYFEENSTDFKLIKLETRNAKVILEEMEKALMMEGRELKEIIEEENIKMEDIPMKLLISRNLSAVNYPILYDDEAMEKGLQIGFKRKDASTFISRKGKKANMKMILDELKMLEMKEIEMM